MDKDRPLQKIQDNAISEQRQKRPFRLIALCDFRCRFLNNRYETTMQRLFRRDPRGHSAGTTLHMYEREKRRPRFCDSGELSVSYVCDTKIQTKCISNWFKSKETW